MSFIKGIFKKKSIWRSHLGSCLRGVWEGMCSEEIPLGVEAKPSCLIRKVSKTIQQFGLKKSNCDHTMFYKRSEVGAILFLVYVDDIVITWNDVVRISSIKIFFHTRFRTNNLGKLKYFWVVEVTRCKKIFFFCLKESMFFIY